MGHKLGSHKINHFLVKPNFWYRTRAKYLFPSVEDVLKRKKFDIDDIEAINSYTEENNNTDKQYEPPPVITTDEEDDQSEDNE